jgi:peroxiredoxin
VASDVEGKTAKSYELKVRDAAAGKKDTRGNEINHGFAERTTFIITPDGKIAATLTDLTPVANVSKSLEVVQHIAEAKKLEY